MVRVEQQRPSAPGSQQNRRSKVCPTILSSVNKLSYRGMHHTESIVPKPKTILKSDLTSALFSKAMNPSNKWTTPSAFVIVLLSSGQRARNSSLLAISCFRLGVISSVKGIAES